MITLLLLLCGVLMIVAGVWLFLSINEAKTVLDCYFAVMAGIIGLGFGLLLIIGALIAL